jgi:hypothetical protein
VLQATGDKEKEINDCKLIVQNVIYGMKTLLFSILYCTRQIKQQQQQQQTGVPQQPQNPQNLPSMHEDDVRTCARLLVSGLNCLKVAAFFRWGIGQSRARSGVKHDCLGEGEGGGGGVLG